MANCILCKTGGEKITEHSLSCALYACPNCRAHFSEFDKPADYVDYEKIYPGMKEWCQSLKGTPNWWRKVAQRGFPYSRVVEMFMNQDKQYNILDVGCGYGYMVYTLKRLGFIASGIDIVDEPINFAKETFGPEYSKSDVYDYKNKHDAILAIEVFEHVANPREWMKRCLEIAPFVIITTPNLTSYNANWVSDQPPLHMACYRKESLEWLAKDLGVNVKIDDSGHNLLATFYV